MMQESDFLNLLRAETAPATGCTEPAAVALACRRAYECVGGEVLQVVVGTDSGVYKNGLQCVVPGSGARGLSVAAALGVLGGKASHGLNILGSVDEPSRRKASTLVSEGKVSVRRLPDQVGLYIEATVQTNRGTARAIVSGEHDNVVQLDVNGIIHASTHREARRKAVWPSDLGFDEIMSFVRTASLGDLQFLLDGAQMNLELADAGCSPVGISIGHLLSEEHSSATSKSDLRGRAEELTAAAVDARMAGVQRPAWTLCGSGSHGIIATLPVLAVAQGIAATRNDTARALALSCLVTAYAKHHSGRLSAFCGCAFAGGSGASAGVCHLLGGDDESIEQSVQATIAGLAGMICDGASLTCALKAGIAASTAVLYAQLSLAGMRVPRNTGVLGVSADETLKNFSLLTNRATASLNDAILEIMESAESATCPKPER